MPSDNSLFVGKMVQADGSSKAVSPIKIVTGGEFSGSKLVKSEIKSNFYADARRLGVPAVVVDSVIHNMSSKVDFRRSLQKGDKFELLYDSKNVLVYSRITTKRHNVAVYRFANGSNFAYYFDTGIKVAFNKSNSFGQPIKGRLHVSSGFGMRRHPISNVYKMHTGVDLEVSYGSPVYAIYDGVVTRSSSYYGYGHCIDIQHASGYTSRYGHLSKYAVRVGTKVKKGQLIAYSGSSGTSTGPHLHLEIARNNKILNPLSVKMMPEEVAIVPSMKNFNEFKKKVEKVVSFSK